MPGSFEPGDFGNLRGDAIHTSVVQLPAAVSLKKS